MKRFSYINGQNLLDLKVLGIGEGYVGNKEYNIIRDDLEDETQLDPQISEYSDKIFNKIEEMGIFF